MSPATLFPLLSLILALGAVMTIALSEAAGSQPQDADARGRKTITPVVLHEDFASYDFLVRMSSESAARSELSRTPRFSAGTVVSGQTKRRLPKGFSARLSPLGLPT